MICPSYAMGTVARGEGAFSVGLTAQLPLPPAVPVSAGGNANFAWHTTSQTRLFRHSNDPDDEPRFSTLYKLKKMSRPWKDFFYGSGLRSALDPEPKDEDIWVDVSTESTPWGVLEEDGTEEEESD